MEYYTEHDVTAALDSLRLTFVERGGRFRAQCPAHRGEDHNASLWLGADGNLAGVCYSHGCSLEDIRDALAMPYQHPEANVAAVYQRPAGEHGKARVAVVYRTDSVTVRGKSKKRVWWRKGDSAKGARVLLFGADADPDYPDPVVLVEGEKAARTLAGHVQGHRLIAACWAGGVGSVRAADFSPLRGREVVLWPDNDDEGRAAMETAAQILPRYGVAGLRLVDVGGMERKGDAADVSRDIALALINDAAPYKVRLPKADALTDALAKFDPNGLYPIHMASEVGNVIRMVRLDPTVVAMPHIASGRYTGYLENGFGIWNADEAEWERRLLVANKEWMEGWPYNPTKDSHRVILNWTRNSQSIHAASSALQNIGAAHLMAVQCGDEVFHQNILRGFDFDEFDPPGRYIGSPKGVIDLDDPRGVLPREEGRKQLIMSMLPDEYDPDARHTAVDDLFAHIEAQERTWILQAIGFALRGWPSRRAYLLIGETGGGKSTLLECVSIALGADYAERGSDDLLKAPPQSGRGLAPELLPMMNCRIVYLSEAPRGREAVTLHRLLGLAGGDRIAARDLYESGLTTGLTTATLFMACNPDVKGGNELPAWLDVTRDEVRERVRILRYPAIPAERRRVGFADTFRTEKRARQALAALIIRNSVKEPPANIPSVTRETEHARQALTGEVDTFLDAMLMEGKRLKVAIPPLFQQACEAAGERDEPWGLTRTKFAAYIRQRYNLPPAKPEYIGGKMQRSLRGVGLRDEPRTSEMEVESPDGAVTCYAADCGAPVMIDADGLISEHLTPDGSKCANSGAKWG